LCSGQHSLCVVFVERFSAACWQQGNRCISYMPFMVLEGITRRNDMLKAWIGACCEAVSHWNSSPHQCPGWSYDTNKRNHHLYCAGRV
jgi:hypothetical protein